MGALAILLAFVGFFVLVVSGTHRKAESTRSVFWMGAADLEPKGRQLRRVAFAVWLVAAMLALVSAGVLGL